MRGELGLRRSSGLSVGDNDGESPRPHDDVACGALPVGCYCDWDGLPTRPDLNQMELAPGSALR
jgi:hypothetical protein